MKQISNTELQAIKVEELGLDPRALDLTATESLAAALRRAAGLFCPCSFRTLSKAVVQPLRGIAYNLQIVEERIDETLEALVAYGDLIECATELENNRATRYLLHAAAPSFVSRESGAILLVGVLADTSVFPHELASRIEYVNHVRRLVPQPSENLVGTLLDYGLLELSLEAWRNEPTRTTPTHFIRQLDEVLNGVVPSRDIPGLTLLDPDKPVTYYPGRWVTPKKQSGRYVARRSQTYGADLWCYVELKDGQPLRLIDFPIWDANARGCDEAWRAQAAVDASRGKPQVYRIRQAVGGSWIMELFSPVPAWARRRWDAIAEPIAASGCLFAYRITRVELNEEVQFLRDALWLSEKS